MKRELLEDVEGRSLDLIGILSPNNSGGAKETHDKRQDSRCHIQDSDRPPPEYKPQKVFNIFPFYTPEM
jgi:hypothetical protein